MRRPWTTVEMRVLQQQYPKGGYAAVARNLKHYRSPDSVRKQAFRHKLVAPRARPHLNVVRKQKIPQELVDVIKKEACLLKDKTLSEIAAELGVTPNGIRYHIKLARQEARQIGLCNSRPKKKITGITVSCYQTQKGPRWRARVRDAQKKYVAQKSGFEKKAEAQKWAIKTHKKAGKKNG